MRTQVRQLELLLLFLLPLLNLGATTAPDEIVLPEILAIELPKAQMSEVSPKDSPLKELLEASSAGNLKITHDRTKPMSIGGSVVTWTAWEGEPGKSPIHQKKSAYVYVFPFGQTPIGVSGDDHATAGNQSAKVVRDNTGKIHIAWLDVGRPGKDPRVLYRRGLQNSSTGKITWETEAIPVSDTKTGAWNSYVGLAASENAIHFVWSAGGSALYRRLVRTGADWNFEAIRDTRAAGDGYETSPVVSVRGDDEIHVLTPTGGYAISINGGRTWKTDHLPVPARVGLKNPALAVDPTGNDHIVFTATVRNAENWSSTKPNHGYWQLRYVRRDTSGHWVDAQNILEPFPEWADPNNDWDVLSDWAAIAVDKTGNIHLVWHGSANTHIFGNDEAFYSYRRVSANGTWYTWSRPQGLHPVNRVKGEYFSFAPSLCLDETNDLAIAVVFFDSTPGDHLFDVDARLIRHGSVEGSPIVLSRLAQQTNRAGKSQDTLSTWFPVAVPRLFRHPNGRAWLDVLSTAATPEAHKTSDYIVFQSVEVTQLVQKSTR